MLKKIVYLFIFFLTSSCADYNINKKSKLVERNFYTSNGFALIYNDNLFKEGLINKKLISNKIAVMHSFIKTNSTIQLTNPTNSKSIVTKISKRAQYPKIFNIVISERVAEILDLDINNPYIEVLEVKKNKTFVAKKGTMRDEEKNVATNVPVEKIEINNISNKIVNDEKPINNHKYFLIISDFYYEESAVSLEKELILKTKLNYFAVKKIINNKYRLYAGPFKNFNTLKLTYISLNKLGFEDLNIIKK